MKRDILPRTFFFILCNMVRAYLFHFMSPSFFLSFLVFILCLPSVSAQSISGNFSGLKNQPLRLEGFNGLKTYVISSAQSDDKGRFRLPYTKEDFGVGYLISPENKPLFVILSGEEVEITGELLANTQSAHVTRGQENMLFEKYSSEHPRREQALSAWTYLEKLYQSDSLFLVQKVPSKGIRDEKSRINKEDRVFLESLPRSSYVNWFLPIRKLVSSVSIVAQYRPDEIPQTINAFRNLDYTDRRLYKSGLLKDAIESHFWLLENCGKSLDSVNIEMCKSVDVMMSNLIKDEKRLNEVTDFLFDLLEKHSLFQVSEYLALKVLNEVSCTIDHDLAKQLETYRAMKKGNTAPEIFFPSEMRAPGLLNVMPSVQKLSDLQSQFIVVVFGASWCPKCTEELPQMAAKYELWKKHGVEVVFVSLDDNRQNHENFVKDFPFISLCDFKKWEGSIVKEYYVFGTPTMYLLDRSRQIILRPSSVNQMDAWVDWFLIKGNLKK